MEGLVLGRLSKGHGARCERAVGRGCLTIYQDERMPTDIHGARYSGASLCLDDQGRAFH